MATIDAMTQAPYRIDYAHHELHSGSMYFITDHATLGVAATRKLAITTPSGDKWAHMTWDIAGSGEGSIIACEDAEVSGGTSVDIFNANRNSANTSVLTVVHTPTVSASGDQIFEWHFGSGRNVGGGSRGSVEIILKESSTYYVLITSEAASNDISTQLRWYEHTNKHQ